MAEAALGIGILGVIWNVFLLILSICLIVAVFNISGATQRTVRELSKANTRMAKITHHLGINEDECQPPCAQCLKKGKEVKLMRNPRGVLQCPGCGAMRKSV